MPRILLLGLAALAMLCSAVVLIGSPIGKTQAVRGLQVPAGFSISEFAGPDLANDIHCLTIGPAGQILVSGRGYLRQLIDSDGDGRADRVLDFKHPPRDGAMGLLWEKGALYCVGDGALRRYRDPEGAGREQPSEILFKCPTASEHHAHAVGRGPDGWLYLLVGDSTGIGKHHATLPTSPIRDPVGGCVLRFAPDGSGCEIVADGFRNAYAMDWNLDGELFTYDSDNERCVSLPWYEPTRCYHVHPGGHHGWLNRPHTTTWRLPPYAVDVVAPISTHGRGSPTGVVCYRHTQFPPRYRGGLFLLDWTFGIVYFVHLEKQGSTYRGRSEVFLRSLGEEGFAPTAAAVHPQTGDLYLAIGGRGTRGAVYRVRYTGSPLHPLTPGGSPASRPALAGGVAANQLLADIRSKDAHVRRRTLERAVRHARQLSSDTRIALVRASAGDPDRGIRQATARLLATLQEREQNRLADSLRSPLERTTLYLARPSLDAVSLLDADLPTTVRLDGVRLLQIALGDLCTPKYRGTVWEGYTRRQTSVTAPETVRLALRRAFPSGDADLDRELARTLALIEDDAPDTRQRILDRITADSSPIDDIHYLIVLARLGSVPAAEQTRQTARALLALDRKCEAGRHNRDTNWPLRIAELHAGLAGRDPRLDGVLLAQPEFGRPAHALFCRRAGFDRQKAARRFLSRIDAPDFVWNAELIGLVGELPPAESLPVLRRLWGEHGLDEAILNVLSRQAQPADRAAFVQMLPSARLDVAATAWNALSQLPLPEEAESRAEEAQALLRALRQLGKTPTEERLRQEWLKRLSGHADEKLPSLESALAWFSRTYPERAATLSDGVDVAGWQKRLARIAWDQGDAQRGQSVYLKASCAACHSGAAALGPDLRGIAGRFSRDDVFTAIVQPSKDVSPRYRTTQLTTAKGQVYQGIIVYEATDSVLMLTGPGQNIRLAHTQIAERRLTVNSLMPTGLLDRLSDRDIADLYAYLRSLK